MLRKTLYICASVAIAIALGTLLLVAVSHFHETTSTTYAGTYEVHSPEVLVTSEPNCSEYTWRVERFRSGEFVDRYKSCSAAEDCVWVSSPCGYYAKAMAGLVQSELETEVAYLNSTSKHCGDRHIFKSVWPCDSQPSLLVPRCENRKCIGVPIAPNSDI